MQCFTKGTCSTDRVLRELGWTSRQLFYTEHRKSDWSTLLDRDLFGRPPQDNRALRHNTHSSSSCRTTRANSPKESIEDRVLSRDARAVVTAQRLNPSDGEEQLARGEIELDQRLQHGPLPARAKPTDIQVAGVMLRLFQLSVAIGEYRELPRSIRRIAGASARDTWGLPCIFAPALGAILLQCSIGLFAATSIEVIGLSDTAALKPTSRGMVAGETAVAQAAMY